MSNNWNESAQASSAWGANIDEHRKMPNAGKSGNDDGQDERDTRRSSRGKFFLRYFLKWILVFYAELFTFAPFKINQN